MAETNYERLEREAAAKLSELLARPLPEEGMVGESGTFDPWELFPLYGCYSGSFDECALAVLTELETGNKHREDLGAEMFREMLCKLGYCEYGTSPRVCFPTQAFGALLPDFIAKWKAYCALQWPGFEPQIAPHPQQ